MLNRCNYLLKSSMAALAFLAAGSAFSQSGSPMGECEGFSFPALTSARNAVGISFNGVVPRGASPRGRNDNHALNSCIFDIANYDSRSSSITQSISGMTIPHGTFPFTGTAANDRPNDASGKVTAFLDEKSGERYLWIDDLYRGGIADTAFLVHIRNNAGTQRALRVNFRIYREPSGEQVFPTMAYIYQSSVVSGKVVPQSRVGMLPVDTTANGACRSLTIPLPSSIADGEIVSLMLRGDAGVSHGGVGSIVISTDETNESCDMPLPDGKVLSDLLLNPNNVTMPAAAGIDGTLLLETVLENAKDRARMKTP